MKARQLKSKPCVPKELVLAAAKNVFDDGEKLFDLRLITQEILMIRLPIRLQIMFLLMILME